MALIASAGRFFVAELGKTWQSTIGIFGSCFSRAERISFRLPAATSGVAPSSRSFVPTRSTTAAGSSESTSSSRRISTPRVVSPLIPRFATLTPGNAAPSPPPQPCVIESPRNTTACRSCSARLRPLRSALQPELLEPVVAADRARAGQAVVGGGDGEPAGGRLRGTANDPARTGEGDRGEENTAAGVAHGRGCYPPAPPRDSRPLGGGRATAGGAARPAPPDSPRRA